MPLLSYSRRVRIAVIESGSASGSLSLLSSPLAAEVDVDVLAESATASFVALGASLMPPTSMIVVAALELAMPSLTNHSIVRSVVLGLSRLVFS